MTHPSDSEFDYPPPAGGLDDATRFFPDEEDNDDVDGSDFDSDAGGNKSDSAHNSSTRDQSSQGTSVSLGEDLDFELDDSLNSDDSNHTGPLGVLGEYLLLEKVGAGGMGQVFRAEHRTMNRQVAVKVLDARIANNSKLINQFYSEVRAVAKLMHPNIVTAFDAGSSDRHHYLVMELVQGETLLERVNRLGPLNTEQAVDILVQSARALQCAHSFGIVHRDIKPSNMMLTNNGTLKILDFGLALLGAVDESEPKKNIFMGTPEFMSPEQIENADDVDGRSDMYSLGATLFFLLTGQPMFAGEKMQVALAQIRQQAPALFMMRSGVDLRLDAIFQRLVQKNRANRYSNASELLENLRELNLTENSDPTRSNVHSSNLGLSNSRSLLGGGLLKGDQPTSIARNPTTLTRKSQIVAIDLGMVVSTAAYFNPKDGPQLITHGVDNTNHLRNMIWSSKDQIKIGSEAVALRQSHSTQVLHSVQRWIGQNNVSRPLLGREVPPSVALAAILRQIIQNAASATDNSTSAIVTVPGCYDQTHRRAIREACRVAGIDLIQLLDKPVAAGLSWLEVNSRVSASESATENAKLLFVHLGGSGLEAAVLEAGHKTVRQLSVTGHWKFGSLRWQHLLTEYFETVLKEKTGSSIRNDISAATRLQRSVELTLDRLTRSPKVELRFEWQGVTIQQSVTQQGLVKIAPALCNAIVTSVTNALNDAGVDPSQIDHVIFAGGMLKMAPVQKLVTSLLPPKTSVISLEKSDLARGAALQAHYLSQLTQSLKSEELHGIGCAAYSLGLLAASTSSGSLQPRVLMGNATQLPASCTKTIRPKADVGPDQPRFPTLQLIESTNISKDNWNQLAKLKPSEVFPQHHGDDPLQLRFDIDESGVCTPRLLWPQGNQQVAFGSEVYGELSNSEVLSWQKWLETAMLCSTD